MFAKSYIAILFSLLLSSCIEVEIPLGEAIGGGPYASHVNVRAKHLNQDFSIALISIYMLDPYNYYSSKQPVEHDSFVDIAPFVIDKLSRSRYFTVLSSDSITSTHIYRRLKEPRFIPNGVTKFQSYKYLKFSRTQMASLAKELGVDATMIIHISPYVTDYVDGNPVAGLSALVTTTLMVVDSDGEIVFKANLKTKPTYLISEPYTQDKLVKLVNKHIEVELDYLESLLEQKINSSVD